MDIPVVGTYPNYACCLTGNTDTDHAAIVFGTRGIGRQTATFGLLQFSGIIGAEVGTDHIPSFALIRRVMQVLAPEIESVRILGIHGHTGIPIEAQVFAFGMLGFYGLVFMGMGIKMIHITALPHRIAFAGFSGDRRYVETIAKKHLLPFVIFNGTSFPMKCGTHPAAIVLQATVNVIRNLIIDIDVVKLSNGNVLGKAPGFSAVVGDGDTAIVTINNIVGVFGMDQKGVVIGVNGAPIG